MSTRPGCAPPPASFRERPRCTPAPTAPHPLPLSPRCHCRVPPDAQFPSGAVTAWLRNRRAVRPRQKRDRSTHRGYYSVTAKERPLRQVAVTANSGVIGARLEPIRARRRSRGNMGRTPRISRYAGKPLLGLTLHNDLESGYNRRSATVNRLKKSGPADIFNRSRRQTHRCTMRAGADTVLGVT